MLLNVENLSVAFGPAQAVRGVSFNVQKGSFTAIVGESGSGKSVTALSLTRLIRGFRVEGKANFCMDAQRPRDLLSLKPRELMAVRGRAIGYVFQNPAASLNPVLSVEKQLVEAYVAHAPRKDKSGIVPILTQALRQAQLSDPERVLKSYPHQLSGGMRQRVMIAMATLSKPALLIADEPTTALDLKTQHEIMCLLERMRRSHGMSILFITHDLGLAARYADTLYVFQRGQVVEKMDRSMSPQSVYAKRLFAAQLLSGEPKHEIALP